MRQKLSEHTFDDFSAYYDDAFTVQTHFRFFSSKTLLNFLLLSRMISAGMEHLRLS